MARPDALHHPMAGEEWQNIALVKVIKGRFTTQSWLGIPARSEQLHGAACSLTHFEGLILFLS